MGSLALLGCATQESRFRAANHRLPQNISIYVAISDEAAESDDGGSIATMVEALDDDLRERGHHPVIVGARSDEAPPVPRLELRVLTADEGSRGARVAGSALAGSTSLVGFGLLGAGAGDILVDWYVFQADDKVSIAGRMHAPLFGTDAEGEAIEAQRAGRSLAAAVTEG